MDLLEGGREQPLRQRLAAQARRRPGTPVVAGVLVAALLALGGAVAAVAPVRERATAVQAALAVAGSSSSTVAGVARGTLRLELRSTGRPARLAGLVVEAEGLRVLAVRPAGEVLPAGGTLVVEVGYEVPSCAALVLPGRVVASLTAGGPVRRVTAPLVDAAAGEAGLAFAACPASARQARPGTPTDVGVRPAGGSAQRTGAGAEGVARLEVRNAGADVRLLGVDVELDGARVTGRVLRGGRTLTTDEVVVVRLAFVVPDCALLAPRGRLLLRLERFGGVQQVSVPLQQGRQAGDGATVDLPVLLGACGG